MPKIFLIEDISDFYINLENGIVVVHEKYPKPKGDYEYVSFSEFRSNPRRYLNNVKRLVLVGLTKMITPSNRTEMVWEIVYNNTPEIEKFVVDFLPFRTDPWRLWFLFGAVGEKYLDYTYSYIAETHYNAFKEGIRKDNPFSLDIIVEEGEGVIVSNYKQYFRKVKVKTIKLDDKIHARYLELKERCFEEENTINRIISRLSKFAQNVCPKRRVPSKTALFNRREWEIIRTDLKVDEFLVSELIERIKLVNGILGEFYDGRVQELQCL